MASLKRLCSLQQKPECSGRKISGGRIKGMCRAEAVKTEQVRVWLDGVENEGGEEKGTKAEAGLKRPMFQARSWDFPLQVSGASGGKGTGPRKNFE